MKSLLCVAVSVVFSWVAVAARTELPDDPAYDLRPGFSFAGRVRFDRTEGPRDGRHLVFRDCESYQCSSGFNMSGADTFVTRMFCHDNYAHNTSPHPYNISSRAWMTDSVFDVCGEDVGYVTLRVVDAEGHVVPTAKIPVKATVTGAGTFHSMENGDETDFTWLRDPERKTLNGYLTVLVKANPGAKGTLSVTSPGLPAATCPIAVR